jgi:ribosome-associated toxin RatA of RatAB toxin-antitoxin module
MHGVDVENYNQFLELLKKDEVLEAIEIELQAKELEL